MGIRLKVENLDRLSNGQPAIFETERPEFAIGREGQAWNLPDPDMFISGRHCEIRGENGVYWLRDVSRNGTFVNGSNTRLSSPHRLSSGDRVKIGRYIIAIAVSGPGQAQGPAPQGRATAEDFAPQAMSQPPAATPEFSFGNDAFSRSEPPGAPPAYSQPPRTGNLYETPHAQQEPQVGEFLRMVATGAGVSQSIFAGRDEREVAFEIGAVLKMAVEETSMLLKARAAAKVLAKSSHRTMIGGSDNNPLKFLPAAEEIMEVMFARRRPGYMDARRGFQDAFNDLKTHEIATYAAMQAALSRLLDDLSPHTIEKKLPSSAFGSKKARAWEAISAVWESREAAHENGLLDVFLAYFSEAYAKASKPKS